MFDEPRTEVRRRRIPSHLLLLLIAGAAIGPDARAETGPGKPHPTRKVFDLTPPRPGEVLANPAKGSGSPPRLKEYAPTAAIRLAQEPAGDATSDAAETQSAQGGSDPGRSDTGARSGAAGPAVLPSDLQKQLGGQIAQLGIEGFLSRQSPAPSPQEQHSWEQVRHDIATSLATWKALYVSSPAPKDAAPIAPASPEAGTKKP